MSAATSLGDPSIPAWRKESRTFESLKKELKEIRSVASRMEDEISKLKAENADLQAAKNQDLYNAIARQDYVDLTAQEDASKPLHADFRAAIDEYNIAAAALGELQKETMALKPGNLHMEPADRLKMSDMDLWMKEKRNLKGLRRELRNIKNMKGMMEDEAKVLRRENGRLHGG